MTKLRLALFDFDGTLTDSLATIQRITKDACKTAGAPIPDDAEIRANIGQGLLVSAISYAQGDTELGQVIFDEYRRQHRRELANPDGERDKLFDGAEECVRALAADGWLLGIVTNKGRHGLDTLLDGYGMIDLFDVRMTADDTVVKPAPDMALAALARTGAEAQHTYLIGDTLNDAHCAKGAGVHFIGVGWGYHDAGELTAAGAVHIARDFDDLYHVLSTSLPD